MKCSRYMNADVNDPSWYPCNCPSCGGFLKWNGEIPTCKKCGVELIVIPDRDEDSGELLEYGKICSISTSAEESKPK